MATVHPCRKDRHNYEAIGGAIAGLGRRSCVTCGAVQIDIRSHRSAVTDGESVFFARKPSLFSLRADAGVEEVGAAKSGFGQRRRSR